MKTARVILAVVLSVCAIAAVTVHELAPEALAAMRAKVVVPAPAPAGPPAVDVEPPVDPADSEPTGPAAPRPAPAEATTRLAQVEAPQRQIQVEPTARPVQVGPRTKHRAPSRPSRRRLADR